MSVAKRFYWEERTTLEFDEPAAQDPIAILPVAATEQHGPHLSVATDSAIGRGMLECLGADPWRHFGIGAASSGRRQVNEHHLAQELLPFLPKRSLRPG